MRKKTNFCTSQKDLRLSSRKFGEKGINFVVLHGMFGSGKNWSTFAESFKENFRIWALDARNHGDSPHSDYMNYYEMSEDVINFLNKNGIKKIILLGHSMGGKTAMHLALNYQERVLALIVVDIAPLKYTHYREQHEIINSMQEIVFKPEMSRAEIEKKLRQKIHDKRIISFLMTNLIRHQNQFKWRIGLDEIKSSILELASFPNQENIFSGPTKFIRGVNSEYIRTENHLKIREFFPNSSIESIRNCGHWPNHERPMEFQKAVKLFLKQSGLL